MINDVYKTVLSILNKNNYGYITPQDFNLYAKQAQLDILDDYFTNYNYQVNKENARQSGTGYADLKKGYEEVIDGLSETKNLTQNATNTYFLPSQVTTSDDYYLINKVLCSRGATFLGEAERVSHSKITMLNTHLLLHLPRSFLHTFKTVRSSLYFLAQLTVQMTYKHSTLGILKILNGHLRL